MRVPKVFGRILDRGIIMQIELTSNYKGKCLIAVPGMKDDVFSNAVIYITEHNSVSGAIGVIINKTLPDSKPVMSTNFDFSKYTQEWSNIPFYFGGPVELGSGFVLHDSVSDSSDLVLTGDRRKIHQLASSGTVKPWILTAGYCLWDSFQLEREIRHNTWLIVDGSPQHFFQEIHPQDRYREALKLAGVKNIANFDFNGAGNA